MTKRIAVLLTLVVMLIGVRVGTAEAANDNSPKNKAIRVGNFSFKPNRRKPVAIGQIMDMSAAEKKADANIPVPRALGFARTPATAGASPGFTVEKSFNDDQFFPSNPRTVDFRGTPDVHFVYSDVSNTNSNSAFGYNVYSPTLGSWPQGAEVGCQIQTSDADGRWSAMDVNGKGFVIIAGVDDISGQLDNHFYYQGSQYSCFWGGGTVITAAQYNVNFLDASNQLHHPRIELQEWAGDTITHAIGIEDAPTAVVGGDLGENSLNYFRKFGSGVSGAWEGPETLDSVNRSSGRQFINTGSITSSRVSPKVAVVYTHFHQEAYNHVLAGSHLTTQARYDNEIYYRENDSIGEPSAWSIIKNATNYSRVVASQTAFIEVTSLYDSEDGLHMVWGAQLTVDTVYDDINFFWGDFSQSMYHWSDRTGEISKVVNADFGIAVNTQVCGFPGPGKSYVGDYQISECDGNLYAILTYNLDFFGILGTFPGGQIDDCTLMGTRATSAQANGEIVMSVSSSLDGLLWDAVRNITKTYTPDCDSAVSLNGKGVCENENMPTVSRYGMDEAAMTATFGTLTWPGAALIDMSPAENYAGGHYLQLFYLEDLLPGPGWRPDAAGNPDTGRWLGLTFNPLQWGRLACVDPVSAPQIFFAPLQVGYPNQTNHGTDSVVTVTVTNEGNTALNISGIEIVETSGPTTGWLDVSTTSLSVPAGTFNTATFDVIINAAGVINNPGTVQSVSGEIRMLTDAPAPRDTVSFFINNFIIGPVADQKWDSVSTGAIQLTVASNGEIGNFGLGGANMDYTASALDCDITQNVYLFDGSLVLAQKIDSAAGDFRLSTNLFTQGFGPSEAFKPVSDQTLPSHDIGPDGSDILNTGTFVNWDSSIAVEQTFYAPTTGAPNDDFIIMKSMFFSNDGQPHANLLIGDVFDWDTPSDNGALNIAGTVGNTVYLKGIDTAMTPGCQLFDNRYSASAFLGHYEASDLNPCANDRKAYGTYASINGNTNPAAAGSPNGAIDSALLWNEGGSLTGEWTPIDTAIDQRINQTYVFDYTLAADDTLVVYTALTTVLNGTESDLDANVKAACDWYAANLRNNCPVCSCCKGTTGNIDNDPMDIADIADLTFLIDNLFINFTAIPCKEEGNIDGSTDGVVDIADLTFLIDNLFINFTPTSDCQ